SPAAHCERGGNETRRSEEGNGAAAERQLLVTPRRTTDQGPRTNILSYARRSQIVNTGLSRSPIPSPQDGGFPAREARARPSRRGTRVVKAAHGLVRSTEGWMGRSAAS